MAQVATLERRRREMAAAYVKAARRHAPRAALARKMVAATCAALRAEISDRAPTSARKTPPGRGLGWPGSTPAASPPPDLFTLAGLTP